MKSRNRRIAWAAEPIADDSSWPLAMEYAALTHECLSDGELRAVILENEMLKINFFPGCYMDFLDKRSGATSAGKHGFSLNLEDADPTLISFDFSVGAQPARPDRNHIEDYSEKAAYRLRVLEATEDSILYMVEGSPEGSGMEWLFERSELRWAS